MNLFNQKAFDKVKNDFIHPSKYEFRRLQAKSIELQYNPTAKNVMAARIKIICNETCFSLSPKNMRQVFKFTILGDSGMWLTILISFWHK